MSVYTVSGQTTHKSNALRPDTTEYVSGNKMRNGSILLIGLLVVTTKLCAQSKSYFDKYENPSDSIQHVAIINAENWIKHCAELNGVDSIGDFSKLQTGYGADTYDLIVELNTHGDSLSINEINQKIKQIEQADIYHLFAKCIHKNFHRQGSIRFYFDAFGVLKIVNVWYHDEMSYWYDSNCKAK